MDIFKGEFRKLSPGNNEGVVRSHFSSLSNFRERKWQLGGLQGHLNVYIYKKKGGREVIYLFSWRKKIWEE